MHVFVYGSPGNCVCLRCMNDYVVVDQQLVENDHGEVVGGGGEHTLYMFRVTVTNRCCCEVSNVVVAAPGFQSAVPVDPTLFRWIPGGEEKNYYLVGDGEAILNNGSSVTFFYVWSTVFRMDVVSVSHRESDVSHRESAARRLEEQLSPSAREPSPAAKPGTWRMRARNRRTRSSARSWRHGGSGEGVGVPWLRD